MNLRILVLDLLALGPSTPALAQHGADGFCSASAQHRLAALDGQWSPKQGAGSFVTAGIVMSLPPHGGKSLTLEFLPGTGYSKLSAQGRQLAMIAAIDADFGTVAA